MGQAKRRNRNKTALALPKVPWAEWKKRLGDLNWRAACLAKWQTVRQHVVPYWQQLPGFHRKALMVLVPVVFILFLLPDSEPELNIPGSQPVRQELDLNLGEAPRLPVGQRPEPPSPARSAQRQSSVAQPQTPETSSSSTAWQSYEVKQGETLATIFRAQSLPLTDLYAIAAIEGKDKPLSQIKSGQLMRYKQRDNGDLDVLQIESRSGDPVMFFRRSDGSFARGK
ncbi:LysM-like peptidoglycan-binding domain-containing protein [Photobacterium galatheae]|uniref:LysM domain-containing protein n=1 Tax=Photobacterium galatheae TaxID=1654360 RepID=A0A066RRQ4_9GAMM|nr:LysM-like peptidoglycan-binding domain-containing protein [Photobacterium galatheae]KDM90367.1 hypothetical protein EA58_17905 [Photobacterium galatheae]MCM0150754.1 hypothetical protein [Photobacterium galatheae]